MEKVRRVSLVQSAIEQLRSQITAGHWAVGDRIPSEAELTETLGVSRASVREAVRALVQAGLLRARQGDGTYVVATDPGEVALRRRLDVADNLELIEVRRGLDLVASRLAALARTREDLDRLRASWQARRDRAATGDIEGFADADVAFHLGVAAASHNRLLIDLYDGLSHTLRASLLDDQCITRAGPGNVDAHDDLYTALVSGDPAAATTAAVSILDAQQESLHVVPEQR